MRNSIDIDIDKRTFELSHPDKLMFPEDGITKKDLVDYYRKVAPVMLPLMETKPVVMLRYPDGIHGEEFFHKNAPDYFPGWIKRVALGKETKTDYVTVDSAADLAYLAGQACITPHLWLSRFDKPDYPDTLIFDLDPSGDDFEIVRDTAFKLKDALSDLGMKPFVKTTGSRGLHVTCFLDRKADFDESRDFARDVAEMLADADPDNLTVEARKEKRGGRLLIDYLRNAYGATAVAPYAVRARVGAPVATPIGWDELKDPRLNSRFYNMKNIFRRLGQKQPWKDISAGPDSIEQARKKLKGLSRK